MRLRHFGTETLLRHMYQDTLHSYSVSRNFYYKLSLICARRGRTNHPLWLNARSTGDAVAGGQKEKSECTE